MFNVENMEGRTVARLRNPTTKEIVGFLILWETNQIEPLWLNELNLKASIEWLPEEEIEDFDLLP